jgi:long-chain fatty acid transport protein
MITRLVACSLFAGCCALMAASGRSALAQGVVRDSIAATSSGRGGTNIAHSDNLTILLDNPGGLVNLPERERLDFGIDLLVARLQYADPLDRATARLTPFPLPQLAYARKNADSRWAYGLGILAPAGFGATYNLRHILYGKREYSSLGALVKVLPAAAFKVDDRLSVGVAFGLGISHVQLDLPYNLQTGLLAGLPAMVDLKGSGLAPTWGAGLQYKLSEQTTAGLAFIGETRFRLRGRAKVDVSGIGFSPLKADYRDDAHLVWPASLGAGIAHRLGEKHRVSADVLWVGWSDAYDKLDLKLSDGSNPLFNLVLGRKVRDTVPLDWNDALAFRAGYELFATPTDTFRVGYIFHDSPIPSATLIPNLAGTLEHAVSIGYGHQWKRWRVDLAYQYSWGPTNHVSHSRIVGGDYDYSTMTAQAHWFFLSFSYRF